MTAPDSTPTPPCGLRLSVYRNAERPADATLDGISSRFTQLTVIGIIDETADGRDARPRPLAPGCQPHSADPRDSAVYLRIRTVMGSICYHLEPADLGVPAQLRPHYMAGGNYAGTTDSRWSDLFPIFGTSVISVHDRDETRR